MAESAEPFVVMEAIPKRFWYCLLLLFVFIVVLPTALELAADEPIGIFRIVATIVFVLIPPLLWIVPKAKLATIDAHGVSMRKQRQLRWDDMHQIEVGPAHHFARLYRWTWGDNQMISFVPKSDAPRYWDGAERLTARLWGTPFVIATFMSESNVESIIAACRQFSDVAVVERTKHQPNR